MVLGRILAMVAEPIYRGDDNLGEVSTCTRGYGALAVPVLIDLMTFFSVFVSPQGSTAGLAMLFTPLWNLLVFVPLGAAVGRWVRNRSNADAL